MAFGYNSVEKSEPVASKYELIKIGDYHVQCVKGDVLAVKNNGIMYKWEIVILDDKYQNRRLWPTMMWKHENPETQKNSRIRVADLMYAAAVEGTFEEDCPEDLIPMVEGAEFIVKIGIGKNQSGEPENIVITYKNMAGTHRSDQGKPAAKKPEPSRQSAPVREKPLDQVKKTYTQPVRQSPPVDEDVPF